MLCYFLCTYRFRYCKPWQGDVINPESAWYYSDYVFGVMSLSVYMLACLLLVGTSLNALGSCDFQITPYKTDRPLNYTLACVITSLNALGSCYLVVTCVTTGSDVLGSCDQLRSCNIKGVKWTNPNLNINRYYPVGKGGTMTTTVCPPASLDAHSASSKSDTASLSPD